MFTYLLTCRKEKGGGGGGGDVEIFWLEFFNESGDIYIK